MKPHLHFPHIEPLEKRIAPAVTVNTVLNPGNNLLDVTFTGDGADDKINVTTDAAGNFKHNFPTGAGTFESASDFDAAIPGVQTLNTAEVNVLKVNAGGGQDSITVITPGDVEVDAGEGDDSVKAEGVKVKVETSAGFDAVKVKGDVLGVTDSAIARFLDVLFGTAEFFEKQGPNGAKDLVVALSGFSLPGGGSQSDAKFQVTGQAATELFVSVILTGQKLRNLDVNLGGENSKLDLKAEQIDVTNTGGNNNLKAAATGNVSASFPSGTNFITIKSAATTTLNGGIGNDTIKGAPNGMNTINGNGGTDLLTGGKLGDTISTGATSVNSMVKAGAGNDILTINGIGTKYFGESGEDAVTITGNNSIGDLGKGNDFAEVISGAHTVMGGADNDNLLSQATSADPNAVVKLFGGAGNDLLSSTSALVHELSGEGGNDRLFGGSAADILHGGAGNDEHDGGAGDDTIDGGGGKFDVLNYDHSTTGDSFIVTINGTQATTNSTDPLNPGTDLFTKIFSFVFTGNGFDNVVDASAAPFETFLDGGDGADTLTGGSRPSQLRGGDGDDTLTGGTGGAIINENIPFNAPASVALTNTSFNGNGLDTLLNITGGSFNSLGGNRTLDFSGFTGRQGVIFNGGGGDEVIMGTTGKDLLFGGGGNDTLIGNGGGDFISGGSGINTLVLTSTGQISGVTVNLTGNAGNATSKIQIGAKTATDKLAFTEIQRFEGTAMNDKFKVKLVNGVFAIEVFAKEGDDQIEASGVGTFTADLGAGRDRLKASNVGGNFFGGADDDIFDLKASKTASTLDGGGENDTFFTKNGVNDNVTGGLGNDTATGDVGDTFSVDIETIFTS